VNGAPAVALRLDLDVARTVEAAVHGGEDTEPIHQFFFALQNQVRVLADLWSNLASAHFHRSQFQEFFGDGVLLQSLSDDMRLRLERFFAPVGIDRPCELPVTAARTRSGRQPTSAVAAG